MEIVISLCLIGLVAITTYFIAAYVSADAAGRLRFLKSFKLGKFAIIYIISIPLFWLAFHYNGYDFGGSLLLAIASSVDLVVLKFNYAAVANLMNDSVYFKVVILICYVLVVLNALLFTFTLFGQHLINLCRRRIKPVMVKTVYLFVGYNEQTASVIKSAPSKNCVSVVLGDLSQTEKDDLLIAKAAYYHCRNTDAYLKLCQSLSKKLRYKQVRMIINTQDDAKNLVFVSALCDLLNAIGNGNSGAFAVCGAASDKGRRKARDFRAYVFGEPENESAFVYFVNKSTGLIRFINKYKLIAMDFVDQYPLTRFMTERELDTSCGMVEADTDVNVLMIGFGKTNYNLFLTSVANNQLLRKTADGCAPLTVSYTIYDRKDPDHRKNLNFNFRRYENWLKEKHEGHYFDFPQKPAQAEFVQKDINEPDFYEEIRHKMLAKAGTKSFGYVIIAFGTDMENLDLAEKVVTKLREWNMLDNVKVFVKIRNSDLARDVIDKEFNRNRVFYVFGSEKDLVYRIDTITNERVEGIAMRRHLCYALENCASSDEEAYLRQKAEQKWFGWSQTQRESNIYAALSLRLKLHSLGYDYVTAESGAQDCSEEFLAAYTKNDPICVRGNSIEGKAVVDYGDCLFREDTIRYAMAKQEHQRWNSYMITCGFVPANREEYLNRSKEDLMAQRKHINLTTFDGLKEYRDFVVKNTGATLRDADVIKYDYQIMDDAVWLLHATGYVIVRKKASD